MADILEFNRRGKRKPPRNMTSGPAAVIIFPGVRIEREEFNLADRLGARKVVPAKARYISAEE